MTMRQNRKRTNAAMLQWIKGARKRFMLLMCRAMIVGIGQSRVQLARKYKSMRHVSMPNTLTFDELEKMRQEANKQGGSLFIFSMPRSNTFLPTRDSHE